MRTASSQITHSGAFGQIEGLDAASAADAKIIAANKDFYRLIAKKYDTYESCAAYPYLQEILEKDLDKIHLSFSSLGRAPRCLDCGGGTGNVALKMLARGWDVTVVDVSGEMLSVLKNKAMAKGHFPKIIRNPIAQFLATADDSFDLVAFNSVLHHLYSYQRVAEIAAMRVRPGGFFYSNSDPVVPRNRFWTRIFESADIAAAKLMFDPQDVLPGTWRRIQKLFRRHDSLLARPVVSAGDLAEYHAHTGVDDAQILRLLRRQGFTIVEHQRYPAGRTRAAQFLNRHLRLLENFKIIARRTE